MSAVDLERRQRPLVPDLAGLENIKLVGLGGVGGIVARYLCLYLANANRSVCLTLIDGDSFEAGNASRAFFSRFGNKAAVVRDDLFESLVDLPLTLVAIEEYVRPGNLDRLIREGDCVLLCVDNHATRRLVAGHCASLDDVCLISGGNDGVGKDASGRLQRGTYGNVQIHLRRGGRDESPALTAHHPEIEHPADALPTDVSCTEAMLGVPQILFTNLATASAMLNAFFLEACDARTYAEICFDVAEGLMAPVELGPRGGCGTGTHRSPRTWRPRPGRRPGTR